MVVLYQLNCRKIVAQWLGQEPDYRFWGWYKNYSISLSLLMTHIMTIHLNIVNFQPERASTMWATTRCFGLATTLGGRHRKGKSFSIWHHEFRNYFHDKVISYQFKSFWRILKKSFYPAGRGLPGWWGDSLDLEGGEVCSRFYLSSLLPKPTCSWKLKERVSIGTSTQLTSSSSQLGNPTRFYVLPAIVQDFLCLYASS